MFELGLSLLTASVAVIGWCLWQLAARPGARAATGQPALSAEAFRAKARRLLQAAALAEEIADSLESWELMGHIRCGCRSPGVQAKCVCAVLEPPAYPGCDWCCSHEPGACVPLFSLSLSQLRAAAARSAAPAHEGGPARG